MAPPAVDGLPTNTRMQAPIHVSAPPQAYQGQLLQVQQHQQQQQKLVHGSDPHAHHVIAHPPTGPVPPLSSSHSKPRLTPLQTNPQHQQQQQQMIHTPNTPVHPSSTLVQVRSAPPANPTPATGGSQPLSMQKMAVAATRLREQVQTQAQAASSHMQQAAAVAGPSPDATPSASAGAGSPATAVVPSSAPGTQKLLTYALSPTSARALPPSASNTPPSSSSSQKQQQQQQQQQRILLPPAVAAFKVLQPAKDLLEQTWEVAISAVQQEFAVIQADLARSAHERKTLTDFLHRMHADRIQIVAGLHNSQNELKQCTCVSLSVLCMHVLIERDVRTQQA